MRVSRIVVLCLTGCTIHANGDLAEGKQQATAITLPDSGNAQLPSLDVSDCPGGAVAHKAYWTVMHLAAGDNNLEGDIVDDLEEMEKGFKSGTEDKVNMLVQLDKAGWEGTWRYKIEGGHTTIDGNVESPLVAYTAEDSDTGDWRTLASFGEWAALCYPAENYGVIVGGHGGGWSTNEEARGKDAARANRARFHAAEDGENVRSIAPDDSSYNEMTVKDLAQAIDHIEKKTNVEGRTHLEFYGSDACLMQTAEVSYALRSEVKYVIGSAETEPGPGWPYNTIVRDLTSNLQEYRESPHKFVEEIPTWYARSYSQSGGEYHDSMITLAAADVRDMLELRNGVRKVGDALHDLIVEPGDSISADSLKEAVWASRGEVPTFGDGYADLGMFLDELRRNLVNQGVMPEVGATFDGDERIRDLRNAIDSIVADPDAQTGARSLLDKAILSSSAGEQYSGTHGMSIYFPEDNCGYGLPVEDYAKLNSFAHGGSGYEGWGSFLMALTDSGQSIAPATVLAEGYYEIGHGTMELAFNGVDEELWGHGEVEWGEAWVDFEGDHHYVYIGLHIKPDGALTIADLYVENYETGLECEWYGSKNIEDGRVEDELITGSTQIEAECRTWTQGAYQSMGELPVSFSFDIDDFYAYDYDDEYCY